MTKRDDIIEPLTATEIQQRLESMRGLDTSAFLKPLVERMKSLLKAWDKEQSDD